MSPDWIGSKKATINPKNEKENECFNWSIIAGLNYKKIKEKELTKLLKFSRFDTDISSYQRDWEDFQQENTSIAPIIFFRSHNSEEVMLAYKSSYNSCNNPVIFEMNNSETNNGYYFAVKHLSELNSLGWLWGKEEVIVNNKNNTDNKKKTILNIL